MSANNQKIKKLHCKISKLPLPDKVFTAKSDDSVNKVLGLMKNNNLGSVVITNETGRAEGIITERDFLFKICGEDFDFETTTVERFMTKHPTTVEENRPLLDVIRFMHLGAFRHIIIVDKSEKVKSLASIKDIMEYLDDILDEYENAA